MGTTIMVDGAAISARIIVESAIDLANNTMLVAAVEAADLVGTLSSAEPFRALPPTAAAFEKLPAETVDGLLRPESEALSKGVPNYPIAPGRLFAADTVGWIPG